jgi:hypothetical protein
MLNQKSKEERDQKLSQTTIHQCQCELCQSGSDHDEKIIHHQINVVMSRLDEQQRRWYAAVEANRRGQGGQRVVSQITGLDEKTISRGQQELSLDLSGRPADRIRLPGAGRPLSEKKSQPSSSS